MDGVTVLGLGAMGSALARAFLGQGLTTTVWNRTPARGDDLVARGARRTGDVAEAVAAGSLVVVCLTDHDAVAQVLDAAGDALPGRTVADLTTGSPEQARDTAARVRPAACLNGVVQAGPEQIGTPQATFFYSGPPEAYAAHRTAFDALGTAHHVGAEPGLAAVYDLALLGLWYDAALAYLNALALVGGAGNVAPEAFAPFAGRQLGHVVGAADDVAREVRDRAYPRGPASLTEHAPVLEHLVRLRATANLGTAHLEDALSLVRRRISAGHGADGFTSLIEELG
ncbi:NAD(P)-binding domain-containing protein [Nonomuraea sp. NPDC050643]|uniref:NAD(P)-dependent oxidoreductase n=1 Tax=Nonomuraea sp. NPDC050643 TaxID=3155660 RepID=UPI0033DC2CF9